MYFFKRVLSHKKAFPFAYPGLTVQINPTFKPLAYIPQRSIHISINPAFQEKVDYVGLFNEGVKKFDRSEYNSSIAVLKAYLESYNHSDRKDLERAAEAYERIGSAHYHLQEFNHCIQNILKSLSLREKYPVGDKTDIIRNMNVLAKAYDKIKNYEEAINCNQKLLTISLEALGNKDSFIGNIYGYLGQLHGKLGQHKKAISYYQMAIEIGIQAYGENHPSLATVYNKIGDSYLEMGDYLNAIDQFDRGIKLMANNHGEKHLIVAMLYNNLGVACRRAGRYQEALDLALRAVEIAFDFVGGESIVLANYFNGVGLAYKDMRDYEKAKAYFLACYKFQQQYLGRDPDMVFTIINVGQALHGQQEYVNAIEHYEVALENYRYFTEKLDKTVALIHYHIACSYLSLGKIEDALSNIEYSIKIKEDIFGEDHEEVMSLYYKAGEILGIKGDFQAARERIEKGLQIAMKMPEKPLSIANGIETIALLNHMEGNTSDAIEKYKEAETQKINTYGENHIELVGLYERMKEFYKDQGDIEGAKEYLNKIDKIMKKYQI